MGWNGDMAGDGMGLDEIGSDGDGGGDEIGWNEIG